MEAKKEIVPPWIIYPDYPPGDGFWRQSGENWLQFVWLPYWQSLPSQEQEQYLMRWKVPEVWRTYYFNADFKQWLDSVDD